MALESTSSTKVEVEAQKRGTVTLIDAHNAGGGTHLYLLNVRREN